MQQQELQQLQAWFQSVDADKSGEITALELSRAQFGRVKFSLPTAKMLVKVFDKDRSGQISKYSFCRIIGVASQL